MKEKDIKSETKITEVMAGRITPMPSNTLNPKVVITKPTDKK